METVIAIVAFAVCALAFESRVTRIPDGPPTDAEFQAAVEWQMQEDGVDSAEAEDGQGI